MKKRNYYTFDTPVLVLMNDNFISVNRMLVDVTDNHPHLIRFFAESDGVYESDLVCAAHYHNTFELTKPNHNESVITLKNVDSYIHGKPAIYSEDYDDVYDLVSIEISDLGYITFHLSCDQIVAVKATVESIRFEPAIIYHEHEHLF